MKINDGAATSFTRDLFFQARYSRVDARPKAIADQPTSVKQSSDGSFHYSTLNMGIFETENIQNGKFSINISC